MQEYSRVPVEFRQITTDFLDLSRNWLADQEFRELMMAEPVDPEKQIIWYEGLKNRQDYKIWGIMLQGRWIGACGIKAISPDLGTAEYWGYIYPVQLQGLGIGRQMFAFCRQEAMKLNIKILNLKVHIKNSRAIKSYLNWGFSYTPSVSSEFSCMEIKL